MQCKGFDHLRHLVELHRPARDKAFGDRSTYGLAHRARHQRAARVAARHQPRRDVDAVAEQVAVRLHDNVAEMDADADFRFAGFCKGEGGLDGREA